ncbi:NAD(P)H-binding protein, partial [Nonomuraea ceibae]|uniref:NAD(P)H-binding protein n=1 Tax=Nonomuraea ceibae TaxID=1935170 RepID=UPI001C5CC834
MSKYVIFGAGGRAGRQAVAEARGRGHQVTAVVRDPSRYTGPADDGVRVAAGDVTDAAAVAAPP